MALHISQAPHDSTLTLYAGQEEQAPDAWAEQYVDVWLLLEVTAEDEAGEPLRAKLIVYTTDPMHEAFQRLWRTYADRGILTLLLHGRYSEPQLITVRRDSWVVRALADTGVQISLFHPRLVSN